MPIKAHSMYNSIEYTSKDVYSTPLMVVLPIILSISIGLINDRSSGLIALDSIRSLDLHNKCHDNCQQAT